MRSPLLISLHIPKTAGTSFKLALEEALGPERLLIDYGHAEAFARLSEAGCPPLELHRRWLDMGYLEAGRAYKSAKASLTPSIACVHGHFPAVKYLPALAERPVRFVTWLREPLSRMLSNYHYWMSLDPGSVEDPLVRRILEEDWSLEDYCLNPALANYQSLWLRRVPKQLFSFVGVMEHFEEELARFSDHLRAKGLSREVLRPSHANAGPPAENSLEETARLTAPRPKFETLHDRDMTLYRWALKRRERALSGQA